ncbi:MAG TPA: low specificity L-threonine aldolase [Aliiroseovarius sp.]|nr:low specificity L-threonine aldolase [Aliiroseovarius sp.]
MFFASDNTGPVHPAIMAAIGDANEGYSTSYGDDQIMAGVQDQLRDIFAAPDAVVYLVPTGTASNSLALATLCPPYATTFCTAQSHIQQDECNAPEFYSGGAKLTLVDSTDAKMTPETLRRALSGEENRGIHGPKRGPVSISNVTELGTVYSAAELADLCAVAGEFDLPVHLDGARFANAVVATGASPADMSVKAGIDVLSFGATKNGAMGVEAVVFFDPQHGREFEYRRKRGAHLFSKHRFLSAQMSAYLQDGLWLDLAHKANAATARLVQGLRAISDVRILHQPDANIVFASWPRGLHRKLLQSGAVYFMEGRLDAGDPDEHLTARLVCDWSATARNTDRFLALMQAG